MRIKEVSEKTGLTEKAIRLYVENGLIYPQVEEGLYRKSYTFSEANVRELEEISVFRKAGFSIFEISLIKEMPEKLPELLDKKRLSLEMEIDEKKSIKEAISRLEVHELGSASQIAEALRPAVKSEGEIKETVQRKWLYIVISILVIAIFLLYVYSKGGMFGVKFLGGFLCVLVGFISVIMTIRYMTCTKRASKLPHKGNGTIISVVEEHGFDASFSGAGGANAGSKEPGVGVIWQIFFMLWNEIRPDCWYPVILYTNDEGKKESATLPYGSFKGTWQVGDAIDVAWKDVTLSIVYPLDKKWIAKKVMYYAFVSLVAFLLLVMFIMI